MCDTFSISSSFWVGEAFLSKILEFDIFLHLVIFNDFLGQSWVTRKKKHAHYVLRKWIWLISNWSHTRFEHYSLPNRWTRGNAKLLLLFPICSMFHSLEFSQSTDMCLVLASHTWNGCKWQHRGSLSDLLFNLWQNCGNGCKLWKVVIIFGSLTICCLFLMFAFWCWGLDLLNRLVAEINSEWKQKPQKAKPNVFEGRMHVSNVGVIKRNLVYITGYPLDRADEDVGS